MRSRRPIARRVTTWLLAGAVLAAGSGCGDDADEIGATADERAAQARGAALESGLDEDVADFLGLLARGDTATYRVRFPGPAEGTELVIVNRPPDRRVELLAEGTAAEVRLVTGGQAFTCTPEGADGELSCERTDALVEPPGVFRPDALEDLSESLAAGADDYTFEIETMPVAGIDARCLVTRLRAGRESAERASSGTICASPEGALVLVDQGDDRLEATEYGTDVDDDAFIRPDRAGHDAGS